MHPCLTIDEVLTEIARCLTERMDAVAMALVCKTFYSPAMAEAWHTVDDVLRLLPLFPIGVIGYWIRENHDIYYLEDWVRAEDTFASYLVGWVRVGTCCSHMNSPRPQCVRRSPTPEEWARFNQHARRVRSLHWEGSSLERVDDAIRLSLLDIIESHYHAAAFPGLCTLIVDMLCVARPEHWAVLTPPGLRKLATMHHWRSWKKSSLPRSAILRHILFTSQSIQTLHINTSVKLDTEAMRIMAQMPCLRQLSLDTDTGFEKFDDPHNLDRLEFPVLEDLKLIFGLLKNHDIVDPCSNTVRFLELVSSCSIKQLYIHHVNTAPTPGTLYALLKAMAQFSNSLENCSLAIGYSRVLRIFSCWNGISNPSIPFSDLLPSLLALKRSLTHLDLSFVPLDIRSSDLRSLLYAYPSVRTLRLGEMNPNTRSSLSADDIVAISESCLRLEELGLPILRACAKGRANVEHFAPSKHTLRRLTFGRLDDTEQSEVNANHAMARWCFPHAETMDRSASIRR
ncbi:hypothetical protein PHLGIDRAFT_148864 [Phlebiopsis gigantea 11061_1 CR5-6]|uniref:F-box domain-containing protein n=1 Tax=Phlebiopsis gigantea (strain 11061_1 CR5-6) TaxID=745531 RepID=A0A0C3PHW7_PHLG1|nr:hypothetical protein PHLGIDRAFT_148864 [Phlebiopsis gigantea 11061_1 CR5-6]